MADIQKHSVEFMHQNKTIRYNVWMKQEVEEKPDTVIFLGAGQINRVTKWVAKAAPAGVVVVDGLPHWELDSDHQDLADFATKYTESALKIALEMLGIDSINIISESQATFGVIHAAINRPRLIKNIVLIRPLGLNTDFYGSNPTQRLKTMKKRIMFTFPSYFRSAVHDIRLFAVMFTVFGAMLKEQSIHSFNQKYKVGISYNAVEDLKKLLAIQKQKNKNISLLINKRDKLFPTHEIQSTLKKNNLNINTIAILHGIHQSLALKQSKDELLLAIATARSK